MSLILRRILLRYPRPSSNYSNQYCWGLCNESFPITILLSHLLLTPTIPPHLIPPKILPTITAASLSHPLSPSPFPLFPNPISAPAYPKLPPAYPHPTASLTAIPTLSLLLLSVLALTPPLFMISVTLRPIADARERQKKEGREGVSRAVRRGVRREVGVDGFCCGSGEGVGVGVLERMDSR